MFLEDPLVYGDRWNDDDDDGMDALLRALEESGAEGKPDPETRQVVSRHLLKAFCEDLFGRIAMDGVPRRGTPKQRQAAESRGDNSSREHEENHVSFCPKSRRRGSSDRVEQSDDALSRVDWWSVSAWEMAEVRRV